MADSVQAGNLVGQRLGKYELLALLAIGGTAEIYLARIGGEAGFEKYVVVKCLLDHLADDAEFVRMFLDEARLGAQLDHSNIVQTLELGEQDNRYFMVMEYLAGMSLAQLARKTQERVAGGLMPIDLVLGLGAQACAGLHYSHERSAASGQQLNIVHRDISPQNLVVSFDGVLKIVDFGIAKADLRQTHTRSGTIKGKFAYMSPEQCLAKPIDRRTDIFALGVIMHELLTARRLFKRSTTYETYQTIVNGKVPTPSSVNNKLDPALDAVVMKALQYDKEGRYESAQAFGEALLGVLHKRGRSISASDIARYYDEHFELELGEHADRMRSLISGRSKTNTDDLTWDSVVKDAADREDEEEEIEVSDVESLIDTHIREPSHTDVEDVGEADTTGDELEGEATRIELNPLESMHKAPSQPDPPAPAPFAAPSPPQRRSQSTMDTDVKDIGGGLSDVTAPTKPVSKPPRDGDRPTVSLSPARDPLARVPNLAPARPTIPAPAGKSGKKPTIPPVGVARRPTMGGMGAMPSASPTGTPGLAAKGRGKLGRPSTATEETTRANKSPRPEIAGRTPQPAGPGPKKTLFAPGGAPAFKPKAPGPDRPGPLDSASKPTDVPGSLNAAANKPTIVPGADAASKPTIVPGGSDVASKPTIVPGGSGASSKPTIVPGEGPSNGSDLVAPARAPFGPPPPLSTDPGAALQEDSKRPLSVPPDTLPGEDDAPTTTAADSQARPNTPPPGDPLHSGPVVPQIGGAPGRPAGPYTPITGEQPPIPDGGGLGPPGLHNQSDSGAKFPPVHTPAAFKPQQPLAPVGPLSGGDLSLLAAEKDEQPPMWQIAAVFFASAGVGIVITLLLAKLF